MKLNLIKSVRQFIADVQQVMNDPYACASEEGKQMWREIEEWEKNRRSCVSKCKSENQSSE